MRRRGAGAVGASLALHALALVAVPLLFPREPELGALFVDLTRWNGPAAADAEGGGSVSSGRPAAGPRAGLRRRRPPLVIPAERRAEVPRAELAPTSPSPAEPESSAAHPAVAAPLAALPVARASSAGNGVTAAGLRGSSEGSTGRTVDAGGGIGIGGRGGGGTGRVPDVSHGTALAAHGSGGGAPLETEYGPYLTRLRRRVQESLRYPPAARRRGLEGTVALEIVIHPDGTLGAVTVTDSSAHAMLDDAALEAVRRLAPEPFPPGVTPRLLRVRLPVVFALE